MIGARASTTAQLKAEAERLGFALAGVCAAVSPPGWSRFESWLAGGFAGEMQYLSERRDAYRHPRHVLDGVRSILMLAANYRTEDPRPSVPGTGRVSRYAWGQDYHVALWNRLNRLAEFLGERWPGARARGVVDTAPLLEREFAQLAGLGWIGKNTLLLNKRLGSWFFLAALLTDVELQPDAPHETDHCGTCRACLDACPTGAFVDAYQLDARRCISYLTIELRDAVPHELRGGVGDWLFGCDVCQDVCPWNRQAPRTSAEAFAPRADTNPVDLATLFLLDDAAFKARFRHSPLWRPKRRGILRNAAIVLGNQRQAGAIDAVSHGLHDDESLVRGACAWALGQIGTSEARRALAGRASIETDAGVSAEIAAALSTIPTASAAADRRPGEASSRSELNLAD